MSPSAFLTFCILGTHFNPDPKWEMILPELAIRAVTLDGKERTVLLMPSVRLHDISKDAKSYSAMRTGAGSWSAFSRETRKNILIPGWMTRPPLR
jgi:hypothetical protein